MPMQPHSERCAPVGNFAVVVIGASVGGIGALRKLAAGLRREIPAALLVVQHIGRCASELPQLLAKLATCRQPTPSKESRSGRDGSMWRRPTTTSCRMPVPIIGCGWPEIPNC